MNRPLLRKNNIPARLGVLTFFLLSLVLSSCTSNGVDTPPLDNSDAIRVYFTGGSHDYKQVITAVTDAIDTAQSSIDIAMYNLNLREVEQALRNAHRRGVNVRLIVESDALDGLVLRSLKSSGIPVVSDGRESLMHNKFMVIDNRQVWTGSLNLTDNGVIEDRNNLVRLVSPSIAEYYTQEFEEMFTAGLFGNNSPEGSPSDGGFKAAAIPVEVYFSPDDGVMDIILDEVASAREEIAFLGYSFTSDPLAQALVEKARQGVRVMGVFDSDMVVANTGSDYEWLLNAGLPVCRDGEEGLMHHKVIVIDQQVVITGSYNFTSSAERFNDENVLILHDPYLAELYLGEYTDISAHCLP
jgi:phosphatidylserine/phosphatidylglycerophosphate/cardiolipin synthase-like enzyme